MSLPLEGEQTTGHAEVILTDCLFCKMVEGTIPCDKVFESDLVLAFRDIRPQAPVHILVIPKVHIPSAQALTSEHEQSVSEIWLSIPQIAQQAQVDANGYRVVTNVGHHGQQTVSHLHFHLLGGRQLGWPPG
jgi:histidine triad (HIT) family protein